MNYELEIAKLIRENKGRFLCEIEIDGVRELAHVPNSAKLSKYVKIDNKLVLVIRNASPSAKTKYQLIAVKSDEGEWIMVNLNILNKLLAEYYEEKGYIVQREKKLSESYKADLVIEDEKGKKTVCEIKGVLADTKEVVFPLHSGERTVRQLLYFRKILKKQEASVKYIFVIMNNNIKKIHFDKTNKEFIKQIRYCIKKQMQIEFFEIDFDRNSIQVREGVEKTFCI